MYFYLEWNDKRPKKVTLTLVKPENINYECSFKIKDQEYHLCARINSSFKDYSFPSKLYYTKNQYLMSHLQKCVRRMDNVKAVKTAKHLIDLDLNSFLRRLPIIMLEDVSIHESITVLVWLMIANTKKFVMKEEIVKWLLGVVYYLANEPEKTEYQNKNVPVHDWKQKLFPEEIKIVLYSLYFRKKYGGMNGDMNMIEYYIGLIIQNKVMVLDEKTPVIKVEMEPLLKKDWVYQANDFHCNRYILTRVKQYFPLIDEEYIKQLIWYFSSSKNNRVFVEYDENLKKEWDKIKKTVKQIQKNCIYY